MAVARYNDNSTIWKAFFESCEPNGLVWCWNKDGKNKFKNNNQISSTVTTSTWALSTEWTRTWPSIGIQMKKCWCFQFVWIWDVVIQGAWIFYRINKDKSDESLPLLTFRRRCQCNFSEIFKGKQIILDPFRNSRYPTRYLLWWHKTLAGAIWTQASSELLKAVNWTGKKTQSSMFVGVLNTSLMKAVLSCTKRTLDAATWNVNLRYMRFGIFQW